MGKIASSGRALIQQHLTDGSDNESVANGDHSSPYMSNAAISSPVRTQMAPTGDGVRLVLFIFEKSIRKFFIDRQL